MAVAADRFAREIVGILAACAVRSRQLNGNPLGGSIIAVLLFSIIHDRQLESMC